MPEQAPYAAERIYGHSFPSNAGQTLRVNLKDHLADEILAEAFVRVVGDIVITGAGPGAATGRENPEGLIRNITARMKPDHGMSAMRDLTPRGQILASLFQEQGFAIREADVPDAAATVAVDFWIPLLYAKPTSVNAIEWGVPMGALDEYNLAITVGDRSDLFSGGVNSWDLSGLVVEVWVGTRKGFPGAKFHAVEQFEEIVPITASQSGFEHVLERGFIYSDLLVYSERDNVLVDGIVNKIRMNSGGREWFPGDSANVPYLKHLARRKLITTSAESLVGLVPFPPFHDGRFTQMPNAGLKRIKLLLDVVRGSGDENVIIRGTRIKPFQLLHQPFAPKRSSKDRKSVV